MASWNSLPREMRQMVLEALVSLGDKQPSRDRRRKPRLARFVTVCREWQETLEPFVFSSLELQPKHLAEFDNVMRGSRRRMLRHLWLRVELARKRRRYTEQTTREEEETNNALFTTAVYDLFSTLGQWSRGSSQTWPELQFELGANSPSDPRYRFGDPGIVENKDYTIGELDFCWVDANRSFAYPSPLPEVDIISKFSILRRTRRYFAPAALLTIFDSLPRLREVRYEPWYFLNEDSQADADEAFGRALRHWPPTVKRVSIFEHCRDFRRHFPGQYLDFDGWDDGWWEGDGHQHDHDHDHDHDHGHHHHHYHHHPGHPPNGSGVDGPDGWDAGSADEDGWETANEDEDAWEDDNSPVSDEPDTQGTESSPGNSGAENSAPSDWVVHSPFDPEAASPPLPPASLPGSILTAIFGGPTPSQSVQEHLAASFGAAAAAAAAAVVGGASGAANAAPSTGGVADASGAAPPQDATAGDDEPMDYITPHLGLGLLFIRPSQGLEELAVSGLIDAVDFFEPFYAKSEAGQSALPSWPNLRWLTLTSPTLLNPTPVDGGIDAVNELLQAAGRAAGRMPNLRVMELYCTDARGGVVFRYQVTDTGTSISWQSAWAPMEATANAPAAPGSVTTVVAGGGNSAATATAPTTVGAASSTAAMIHEELVTAVTAAAMALGAADARMGEDDEDHPRHFRVSSRVKETWGRTARRHTRHDLDPMFEALLPWTNPFNFIHQNLATRELALSGVSSQDILKTLHLPPAMLRLPDSPS
ncbi:hypothetical protein GGTG_14032 [Gaeumannomyces tritici R3-111a-1]|uniref:DUF6546 domain-containing protein n=1 Tax=Gaeumannomyces tritici (strain R3-111a-1) TaxID=644352 RepID=J3PKH6_GAET3|nr:hypothetical protein GGTG_14032 [Gaeumannomyces tritici R3-111a-1]EJT68394.1 hypothetical protein GGTG_14032 [Gaeumannomyces tritici R3-111a-1]